MDQGDLGLGKGWVAGCSAEPGFILSPGRAGVGGLAGIQPPGFFYILGSPLRRGPKNRG